MRCQTHELRAVLRRAREGQGISQRRLAVRAGTSQDAISRIERGVETPTLERFARLMLVLGHEVSLDIEPLTASLSGDELAGAPGQSPVERLREAASWNRVASQLAAAGQSARREGHPATRIGSR